MAQSNNKPNSITSDRGSPSWLTLRKLKRTYSENRATRYFVAQLETRVFLNRFSRTASNFEHQTKLGKQTNWQESGQLLDWRDAIALQIVLISELRDELAMLRVLDERKESLPKGHLDYLKEICGHFGTRVPVTQQMDFDKDGWTKLDKKISEITDLAQSIRQTVNRIRPRISVIDTFNFVSRRSGLEASSLVLGILIVFGAIHSYFYFAAVGASVVNYWTIDDLLLQGLKLSPQVIAYFFLIGLIIRKMRLGLGRKEPGPIITSVVKYGPKLTLTIAVGTGVVLFSLLGFYYGDKKVSQFYEDLRREKSLESAVVSDGTPIKNVRLVGTTSRAAIFLRTQFQDRQLQPASTRGFFSDYSSTWSGVLASLLGNKREQSSHNFLIPFALDRANVLCHSQAGWCEEKMKSASSPVVKSVPLVVALASYPIDIESTKDFAEKVLGCSIADHPRGIPESVFFIDGDDSQMCRTSSDSIQACENVDFIESAEIQSADNLAFWVIGMSSSTGAASINQDLGDKRAKTVAQAMKKSGWESVSMLSVGEAHVIDEHKLTPSSSRHARNRRVDVVACKKNEGQNKHQLNLLSGVSWYL